jgi:3-hydroxybutyryl-CoA dehydrogenase
MGREIATVGIVGLGTMGAGIAEVCARNGITVVGVETDDAGVARGRGHLDSSLRRAVTRGKMTDDDAAAVIARITLGTDLSVLAGADLVIEAIPENLEIKQEMFRRLDAICPQSTILATNTSSLSVTEIAVATKRPSKVIGVHFFNPAPVMPLVEIIRTVVTEADVVADVETFIQRLGKTDVTVGDKAGFIANALLFGYLNHAVTLLESRYATREDIDAAMRLGCGLPMGPLALLDLIGLDSAYAILDTIYHQSRDHLHAPAPLLKQLVTAGLLGRKSGRGFYTYEAPDSSQVVADSSTPDPAGQGVGAREVRLIGVVGTGTMATGIVEVAAKAGYEVIVRARGADKAEASLGALTASLAKAVACGKLADDDKDAALARVRTTTELDDLADCDLVIEAIAEDLAIKQPVFAALGEICKPGAILATTTSSLPVIECATASGRVADVVGMHFFNPAPVMRLVEVVPTVATADDVTATIREVSSRMGKTAVMCHDTAGFIVNRLLFPYLNDAVKMLEAHYATVEDIDAAMKVGCGYPMGPFELLDAVGLDVSLAIQRSLYLEFREPGFAPAPLLEHLVTAGYLGRKTGVGFHDYTKK